MQPLESQPGRPYLAPSTNLCSEINNISLNTIPGGQGGNQWLESVHPRSSVEELVPGDPDYKGTLSAHGEGEGGIWVSRTRE